MLKLSSNIFKGISIFIILPICIFFIFINITFAQDNQLMINEAWVMKTGDNPEWAKSDFDDSKWKSVQVGKNWEKIGNPDYDGYVWYRIRMKVPKELSQSTKHDFLSLSLGFIDDVDVTYFNGEVIGSTGNFPPEYSTAYNIERKYRIPLELIQWDEMNSIAIKVYDGYGPGGLYKGPYALKVPGISEFLELNYNLENSKGIYFSPNPLPIDLNIKNYSNEKYQMNIQCTFKSDHIHKNFVYDIKETSVKINGKGEVKKQFEFHPPKPGFYRIVSIINTQNAGMIKDSIILGIDPEKIKTETTRADDFEEFWEKRKHELGQVDPNFKITQSDQSNDELDVYLVEMRSHENVRIKGWYTVPKKNGPHPAILSVPGYTSTMWPNLERTNVATLSLNPRGHGNSKEDIDPKDNEFMFEGFNPNHPEKYIYVGVFMDCIRAVDFLISRPEIDKKRIGVEGGSQGGGLSFATAALDQRIIFSAPDIPWMGDWAGTIEVERWPTENYPKLIKKHPGLTFADINRILSYFDTMNLASWIKCPVYMSLGLQDDVCPPRNVFATYNQVKSSKSYHVYPFSGHGLGQNHYDLKNNWMAKLLGVEKL